MLSKKENSKHGTMESSSRTAADYRFNNRITHVQGSEKIKNPDSWTEYVLDFLFHTRNAG